MPLEYQELIDEAVTNGVITPDQYLQIPWHERESMQYLFSYDGRRAVADGIIIFDQYLQIPWHERESMQYLFSYDGRQAVAEGIITLNQYLQIPWNERNSMQSLFSCGGRQAVAEGIITLKRYLKIPLNERNSVNYLFSYYQIPAMKENSERYFLSYDRQRLASNRLITLERYLQIPLNDRQNVITALRSVFTQRRIIDGEITIENIIGTPNGVAVAAPNINGAQSTHTTSVHQSVSVSATRLANCYKSMIDGVGLENTIGKAQAYISSLTDDSEKNTAAKRGFSRIIAPDYTFIDHSSQVSIRQLLALAFLAIHDDKERIGSLEDAKMQFVEALYEIQRGYNLSDSGVDKGGQDQYICLPGTFNKFIEKLQGIHPDCHVRFITRETASLKLPIVVREEGMRYLVTFASSNTEEALLILTQLMAQIKEDGVEVIWNHIKDNIAKRMFDEFGSLYRDMADPDFTALIEASKGAELNNLNIFQEKIQNSDLNEHRHDDSETEEEDTISPEETFLIEDSKNVELDNLNIFKEIALQLDKLENKAKNLRDRDHILAYCKAANIVRLLRSLNNDYFTEKKIDYKTYKETFLDIINQERPELDKHRGYKQILGNLLIFIATLGTGQLINKACNGTFLFFNKTDSKKRIDKLSNIIEKMEFTCPSRNLC